MPKTGKRVLTRLAGPRHSHRSFLPCADLDILILVRVAVPVAGLVDQGGKLKSVRKGKARKSVEGQKEVGYLLERAEECECQSPSNLSCSLRRLCGPDKPPLRSAHEYRAAYCSISTLSATL
jgi:hypothetical protein